MMSTDVWAEHRSSDAAATPRRVGLLSVHTSPLAQAGVGDGGGLNVYVDAVARRLTARGIAVDVFTRAEGRDLPPTVRVADGLLVHHVEAGPPGLSKEQLASHLCAFYLGLAQHPATRTLDVLHAHYWMSGWVGRKARQHLGIPLVTSFHTLGRVKNATLAPGDQPEPPLRLHAEARIAASADALIAPTPEEARLLRAEHGAAPSRVHVVEPGVDLGVFHPDHDRDAARRALGGGRIILFVGRLQPLKAPDVAIRALAALDPLLPAGGPPTRLVLVGGPSGNGVGRTDAASLRTLAEDLGVADRVAFLAPRGHRELAALYRAADVVVMPSHSESFGLVALEAQACGTPVVARATGGLRHVLGPHAGGQEGGGTLVDGADPRAFAAAMLPYLTDPAARRAAAERGVARARRFSWERTADRTLEVYRDVLAPEPRVAAQRGA